MSDVIIIYKKEIKNFMARTAMKKWYIILNFINVIIVYMSVAKATFVGELNPLIVSLFAATYTAFLVPNNLSIDTIGGEKFKKTFETLLSTPVNITSIVIGKDLFIFTLCIVNMIISTIINNILTKKFFGVTYLNLFENPIYLLVLFFIMIAVVMIIALGGSILSLVSNTLKLNGYIMSLVMFLEISLIIFCVNTQPVFLLYLLVCNLILVFMLIMATKMFLNKNYIMKYVR